MPQALLQAELVQALKNNEFILYYQPQFNLVTSQLDALEALIRWQHPARGLLLPGEFIPLAETSGLIVPIGEWVLKTACAQNKIWRDKGLPAVRMAVNVSGLQIQQENFIDIVANLLQENAIHPSFLEIELTENIILNNETTIVPQIHKLKSLGVSIALDDFGTGYSSISHLKKIPVDRIKIDKSFVQRIIEDESDATIVRAIITLAEGLNLQVLAEGVETLKQLQALLALECKEVQGFYFSEALTAIDVEVILINYNRNLSSRHDE